LVNRPEPTEYAEYFRGYISKVPDGDIIDILSSQHREFMGLLGNIGEKKGEFRYAPGKWSVKEVVGHVVDTERIFGARALCIARGETVPLPSYDQDAYVEKGNFGARTVEDLAAEFDGLRSSHLALMRSFDDDVLNRRGMAANNEFTVRAVVWTIAGHLNHHLEVLRERYL
jgi:hypothetical protein